MSSNSGLGNCSVWFTEFGDKTKSDMQTRRVHVCAYNLAGDGGPGLWGLEGTGSRQDPPTGM